MWGEGGLNDLYCLTEILVIIKEILIESPSLEILDRIKKRDNYLSCIEGKGIWKKCAVAVSHNSKRYFIFYRDISIIIINTFLLFPCFII